MRTMIIAVAMALGLSACETTAVVATNNKQPQGLLADCNYAAPPEPNKYKAVPWTEKERMWYDSYNQSTLNVSECNARLKQARKLNSEQ